MAEPSPDALVMVVAVRPPCVYSTWVSEADQKAAGTFSLRMLPPHISRHRLPPSAVKDANLEAARPYQRIATALRGAISCGALRSGDQLPTVGQLRDRYQVSPGTASRAIAELKAEGLVSASRGRRAVVNPAPAE